MYVAVKGGEAAILNSYRLIAAQRRGDLQQAELSVTQIREQLKLAVDRVMTEGSVYDPELAALAIKQASGDRFEAIFRLRAYRATLARLEEVARISGGQVPAKTELDTARATLSRSAGASDSAVAGVRAGRLCRVSHRCA